MKVTVKKLADLKPMEKNIRRHSQKQINEYVRSVKMFGQIKPLVVDESGVILIGNGLYEALKAMEVEKADCYVMTGMTEIEKKKLMLADNRVYELGMTDTDIFDEIIRSLDGDIDVPGWDADLLETMNATIREVDELVDGYGSYEPEEVARHSDRPEASQGSTEQAFRAAQSPGRPVDGPEGETPENGVSGPYFVICPKCGERIILTPDDNGGE